MPALSPESVLSFLKPQAAQAFDEIVDALARGECNLFLGAAVHAPPPKDSAYIYPIESRPPVGSGLSQLLAKETHYADRFPEESIYNLQRVSQDYEVVKSRAELINAIRNAVETNRAPSPALKGLARLGFRVIVTTNYDTLFEEALAACAPSKLPFVSSYVSNDRDDNRVLPERTKDLPYNLRPSAEKPFLFKIHGDIRTPNSLVVTEEDYIQFVLRMRDLAPYEPIPKTVLEALRTSPTLFIGYSLRDYNLRLLLKTLRTIVDPNDFPPSYSVDRSPDPLIWHYYSSKRSYVSFIAWDVWKFIPDLYKRLTGQDLPDA